MKSVIFMLNKQNSFIRDFQYLSKEIKQMKMQNNSNKKVSLFNKNLTLKNIKCFSQEIDPKQDNSEEVLRKHPKVRKSES